jgi:uncharacterized damage-inducible protein DinB
MSDLALLVEAFDEAHREFQIALDKIPDGDLWKRPHPRLLSIGELAGHVALAQAIWMLGTGDWKVELSEIPLQSPLLNDGFRYYANAVDKAVCLPLDTLQLADEVQRIHRVARSIVADKNKEDLYPGQWGTWGSLLQYQVFHVAYHAGQIYSVRHLLGHETEDN